MRTQLLWAGLVGFVVTGGVGLACSAGGDKSSGDLVPGDGSGTDSGGGGGADGFHIPDGGSDGFNLGEGGLDTHAPDYGADAFWADDPPPASCGDSGVTPKPPGGTPECPDDKNRQGCPCLKEGSTAACWPGLRKNRSKGVCHDGTTTCVKVGETTLGWGPCNDYKLPTGTTGAAACTCFSGGTWALANLSPCFIGSAPGTYSGAVSTLPNYDSTGKSNPMCPADGKKPSEPWTKTTLKVDCAGHFKLCYTLKAGDGKAPKPTDCTVTQQCAEGDYTTANVVQPWGDLPAWEATDAACASQFASSGGYGEMSVDGTSVECDHVTKVFNTVSYCPLSCSTTPSDPACASCSSGGGGSF
ncbi:MAG: hypothetical protein NVS3B10_10680 [Polyangiales bacterium]